MSVLFVDVFFDSVGVRAVWNVIGVQGDYVFFYMFVVYKVFIYVVQYFIVVNIVVVIRGRDGQWVIVIQLGYKRINDKIVCCECLMYGWWLMYLFCNRFKVVNVEGVGVYIVVLVCQVEWMIEISIGINLVLFFDVKQEFILFVVGFQ